MKRVTRLILLLVTVALPAGWAARDAHAAGTSAGTIISNFASATYTQNGVTSTRNSNINAFMVDDKVSFTLTAADAANVTISPSGRGYMTYVLTNTGNAPHDYTLNAAVTGTLDFTPAASPMFYTDTAGTIPLPIDPNAGGLPYISALAPDSSRTVYMFITAPAQLTDGQQVNYLVTAESYQPANPGSINPPMKSSAQAAIDFTANKNTALLFRHVVLADAHGNGGDLDRDGRYAVIAKDGSGNTIGFRAQTIAVNIVKSATVSDRSGGNQPASGATIHYALSVTASGSGTAFGVAVTDPIPANTTYTAGTLRLNGTALSDAADSDAGDAGGTTAGTLTVKVGDMTSSSPAQTITFDVKID